MRGKSEQYPVIREETTEENFSTQESAEPLLFLEAIVLFPELKREKVERESRLQAQRNNYARQQFSTGKILLLLFSFYLWAFQIVVLTIMRIFKRTLQIITFAICSLKLNKSVT